ncbi:MAG: hypothetical protein CL453_05430 [Acidimicrobiaceae bacterium]|nr:hypothetical protein [Acidimicrobiaceae bacterium]
MLVRIKPRTVSWVLLALVTIVALLVGSFDAGDSETPSERAASLAASIACPQCSGQPVSESSAPIAQVIRAEIKEQVDQGRSDSEIRAYYAEQYGQWVNLNPSASGFDSLVWIAPFLVVGIALGGLTLAFSRRKIDSTGIELTKDEEEQIRAIRKVFSNDEEASPNDLST